MENLQRSIEKSTFKNCAALLDNSPEISQEVIDASKLVNCLIVPRAGLKGSLFYQCIGKNKLSPVICNLDGYAIVPIEQYRDLERKINGNNTR